MKTPHGILPALLTMAVLFTVSCSKDKDTKPKDEQPTVKTVMIEDLPADTAVVDPDGGQPKSTGEFTFFRFSDSTIVDHSDSATAKWDIGFSTTKVIVNNTLHGPGNATGQVIKDKLFDDVINVPETGYRADSTNGNTFDGWYNYNGSTHEISPVPGFIFIIHTNDDKYVKMEIQSYYKGAPKEYTSSAVSRYYTFKYVYTDGNKFTGEE